MKLNPVENSRTFFTRNSKQIVVRDTYINQANPPQEEIKEEIKELKKNVKVEAKEEVKAVVPTPRKKTRRLPKKNNNV